MRVREKISIRRVGCPHCGTDTLIRKTKEVSRQFREITCHCVNEQCGCVFVAAITPIRILVPSAMPDNTVHLPLSRHINVEQLTLALTKPQKRA